MRSLGKPHSDQPLRVRFARALPIVLMACPVPVFLATIVLSADARTTANLVTLALIAAITSLIFRFKPKTRDVLPDGWRRAMIRYADDRIGVSWYQQLWREMSPSNMPSLWVEPLRFPHNALLILPALALVYETAHGGQV